jgi:hypothetical protein
MNYRLSPFSEYSASQNLLCTCFRLYKRTRLLVRRDIFRLVQDKLPTSVRIVGTI